jgi:hypothetical protein
MAIQSAITLMLPWAKAFLVTEIVEAPIYRIAIPARWRYALGASAVTHPFVWFAFPELDLDWTVIAILSETFAVVVEAIFFWKLVRVRLARALLVSILANGSSVAVGLFLRSRFGIV